MPLYQDIHEKDKWQKSTPAAMLEWMKSSSFQKEEILFVLNYWDTQLLLS